MGLEDSVEGDGEGLGIEDVGIIFIRHQDFNTSTTDRG